MSGGPEFAECLRRRIFNVVGAATWQMERLLGLLDIVVNTGVPTAAVECRATPRLLINPDFVQRHCTSDEALFMLVLHELHHIVLGHTRLFDRPTLAHNIAFDAVINAMLCQQFREHRYVGFFEAINPPDRFPGRLLRPPPGWPDRLEFAPEASEAEKRALAALYGSESGGATYVEIFNLLVAECLVLDRSEAVLLGSHDSAPTASTIEPLLKAVLAGIVGSWPRPPINLGGRDEGADVTPWRLPAPVRRPSTRLRSALCGLLRQAGVVTGRGRGTWQRLPLARPYITETVLLQPRDRRIAAWRALHGGWPMLYHTESTVCRPTRVPHPVAHVYLDISGSMDTVMPALSGALAAPHREGRVRLFGFSTVVDEVSGRDLHRCQFENTLGTDINCVLQHLAGLSPTCRPRSVVLLTDGYVGTPRASLLTPLQARGLRFFVGLMPDGHTADLEPLNATITTLPL